MSPLVLLNTFHPNALVFLSVSVDHCGFCQILCYLDRNVDFTVSSFSPI